MAAIANTIKITISTAEDFFFGCSAPAAVFCTGVMLWVGADVGAGAGAGVGAIGSGAGAGTVAEGSGAGVDDSSKLGASSPKDDISESMAIEADSAANAFSIIESADEPSVAIGSGVGAAPIGCIPTIIGSSPN